MPSGVFIGLKKATSSKSETMSDSKGTNNKRQREDEEDEGAEMEEVDTAPRQLVKLPEGSGQRWAGINTAPRRS